MIFFTAIEGFIFLFAFSVLSHRKGFIINNPVKVLLFVFMYTLYTYWLTLFLPNGFQTVPVILLTCLLLNYIFSGTLFKSAIKTFIILILIAVIESATSIPGMLILNKSLSYLTENKLSVLVFSTISKLLELGSIFIIYKYDIHISWLDDRSTNKFRYRQILVIISSVLAIMLGINMFIFDRPSSLFMYNIFSSIFYISIVIGMLFAFREGTKLEIVQYANEMTKENIQQLIEFNEMVAKERHEYKNHLNTIYGLCTLNKQDLSEKVRHYIDNYANNSHTRTLGISSGNDFVDAVINVKYNNALRKGIEVNVEFEHPLSAASIDEDVAVTIISNIIENAFESLEKHEREHKFVHLDTYIEADNYYISISNNGPMISDSDKKKIFKAGYSTKENPSNTRGFGLSIVLAEVSRCGGSISINSTEDVTEFLLTFKVKAQKAVV